MNQASIEYDPTQQQRPLLPFSSSATIADLESEADPLNVETIKGEAIGLVKSALPIVVSTMSQLLIMIPMMAAVGRFGTIALASMNLVSIYAGLGGIAPLSGMAMALDSLCSQAFTAAKNKRLLGIYLQRVLLLFVFLEAAIYPIWWNATTIYKLIGIPDEVAETTGRILRLYFFGIALLFTYECLKSYLFAQGIRRFAVLSQAICLPVGWLSIWLLLVKESTSIGILGVPCVITIVSICFNIFALVFIARFDGYQCWSGWSRSAFTHLMPILKLGLAGSAISFVESLSLHMIDLGVLFLDAPTMAAQAILSVILTGTWVMGTGTAIAACNRVGHLLGASMANRARLVVYITLGISLSTFVALSSVLIVNRYSLADIFTKDSEVATILSAHVPWAAVSGAIQGVNMSLSGILRGQGRQLLIARIRTVSFISFAVPISAVTVAVFHWGLSGLWFGYLVSLVINLCAQLYFISTTQWSLEIERCHSRVNNAMLAASLEDNPEEEDEDII
ncbi:hypothetical protein BX070DRAFT_191141 [Coemansia spiralis]|nr:hypothetical protein BX070DRAFT_191141 [Coemansia spiralis]